VFRKSIRYKNYDYSSSGYYFITICTHFKQHTLAAIERGTSIHTKLGTIAEKCWKRIPHHFQDVRTDSFIVMPNHIHGILQFTETNSVQLGTVMQNYKSVTTRRMNQARKTPAMPAWQDNYFDRIIRTERELNMIRLYIELNPRMWEEGTSLSDVNLTIEQISSLLEGFRPKEL